MTEQIHRLWLTIAPHWFWLALMAAVLIWYSTITIYISVRGAIDIKEMLGRLDQRAKEEGEAVDRRL